MALDNKVLWTEGMFLRPQHMQQQDRFYDLQARTRTKLLHRHYWGVNRLELDQQLLDMGTVAVKRCEAIMRDGTLVSIDSANGDRLLLPATETIQDERIYLALPIILSGSDEADLEDSSNALTRFTCHEVDVKDSNQGQNKVARVNTAKLRLCLLREQDITPDYTTIGLFHIREVSGDGKVVLDESYLPPLLNIGALDTLPTYIKEVQGLLSHRSEAIASRLTSERAGTSEVADFMLLQMVNRYEAQIRHLQQVKGVHPEELFTTLLSLYGEMSCFTQDAKRATSWPSYEHDHLAKSFVSLMGEIRQSLSMVFEQTATELVLQERRYGVKVASIADRTLLDQATFVLGVKADWSKEVVAVRMPTMVKAGGVEQLRDLVNLQLPGIQLEPLTVAPRQIPYHSGFTYFQLEKTPENWAHLQKSGGIAFHFSGEIPGLALELWAVKE